MSKVIHARYPLKHEQANAEGRFAKAYERGMFGKNGFVSSCIAGGFMLKETGLLEAIIMLDDLPNFHELPPFEKKRLLVETILKMDSSHQQITKQNSYFGGNSNAAPIELYSSTETHQHEKQTQHNTQDKQEQFNEAVALARQETQEEIITQEPPAQPEPLAQPEPPEPPAQQNDDEWVMPTRNFGSMGVTINE